MSDISPELVGRMEALVRAWANDARTVAEAQQLGTEARAIVADLPEPFDPDLIEARKMAKNNLLSVSELTGRYSEYATAIDAGEYDNRSKVGVALALAAIKRGRELQKAEGKSV